MTEALDFRREAPIGEVRDGRVYMSHEFYRQLILLRDRTFAGSPLATEPPMASGLSAGGTVATEVGGSIAASMQPVTQQIYDGQVLTWGPYDATPTLTIDAAALPALGAGAQYELAITGASASGGTASLKQRTAGGALTAQSGSSITVIAADPGSIEIHKPTAGDSYNGAYRFSIDYDIEGQLILPGEPSTLVGALVIGCYYRTTFGGALTKIGEQTIFATSEGIVTGATTTLTFSGFPAIGQHADPEFRLVVEDRTFASSNLTDINSVAYETIAGGVVSTATPTNLPLLTLRIDPK